jgi:outer membrane lipoprotein-sorting protein
VKKLVSMVLALAVLAVFSFGCGQYAAKDAKVKCPKCGAVFTIDEGMQQYQKAAGG